MLSLRSIWRGADIKPASSGRCAQEPSGTKVPQDDVNVDIGFQTQALRFCMSFDFTLPSE